jgi:DNA processing protein
MTGPAVAPQEAFAAALAHLPGIGPARLVSLLREDDPETIWGRVVVGEVRRPERDSATAAGGRQATWADAARRRDVAGDWRALLDAGIHAAYFGSPALPALLRDDPEPPGVVFWLGDLGVLARPRVAVIGTRHCTSYGRSVAAELGRDLAECGVCVVSGLALGIDGAAHEGALRAVAGAGPLGVAASGVDYPYPQRHRELWNRVVAAGAVLSETPPGQPAQRWRFPARNRLIAGLVQAVVVVESHAAGGSMLTVAAAADRGIDVLAVPGSVTSPSSMGTNQLLHEGSAPARHAGDVLAALGDFRPWPGTTASRVATARASSSAFGRRTDGPASGRGGPHVEQLSMAPTSAGAARISGDTRGAGTVSAAAAAGAAAAAAAAGPGPGPGPAGSSSGAGLDRAARRVLDAIDRTPTPTSVIADRTGLPIGVLGAVLLNLADRALVQGQGVWWERIDRQ